MAASVEVLVTVVLVCVESSSSLPSSSSDSSCPCSDPLYHCDTFENRCLSCKDICEDQGKFSDCQENCPHYLQSVIFRQTVQKDDLKTLTVMVAVTAVMTSIVMFAVFVLISMKIKKKNRLRKKILPSVFTVDKGKIDIDMKQKDIPSDSQVMKSSISQLPIQRHSLAHGTSMNTMVTQLSQESSKSSVNLPSTDTATTALTNSRRASGTYGKTPRRLPSEDCIPEVGGRCNVAMSPVPGDTRRREYTAPHSQVV